MRLMIAERKPILDEYLALSAAVEELNKTLGARNIRYLWSHSVSHAVDSAPYYYILWKTEGGSGTATLTYKAAADTLIELINELTEQLKFNNSRASRTKRG